MPRRDFVATTLGTIGTVHLRPDPMFVSQPPPAARANRKILIAGGGFTTPFIRYMAALTGKKRPPICHLPTELAGAISRVRRGVVWGKRLNGGGLALTVARGPGILSRYLPCFAAGAPAMFGRVNRCLRDE